MTKPDARIGLWRVVLACFALGACSSEKNEIATNDSPEPVAEVLENVKQQAYSAALPDGALWVADVPGNWNGTLLLYSHGYNRELQPPRSAPDNVRESLLERGYALAGSAYPTAEWAVAEAVPSQVLLLDAFAERYGKPKRIVAWGSSMGGLVTSALSERYPERINGAITMCASSMGAVPMMNMAFDGAFALTTLLPADPPVAVVGNGNNMDGVKRQMAAVNATKETPETRARITLAGVLGGIPGWTREDQSRPAADDFESQVDEMAAMLQWGLFLPRGDQERRAGGIFSGNDGIDFSQLLERSGRSDMVRALYKKAGLDLNADLQRLADAPRVVADEAAVDYMRKNFTSTGQTGVPILSMHTIGDGMTSPSLQQSYLDKVRAVAGNEMIAGLWIERAGHCTQSPAEMLAALGILLERIDSGSWSIDVEALNQDDNVRFVEYIAPSVPRSAVAGSQGA